MQVSSIRSFSQQVLLASLMGVSAAQAAGYTVLDLGPAGAYDINSQGQVLGLNTLWDSDGTAHPLTGLSKGLKLNDQGTVLGIVTTVTSDPRYPGKQIAVRTADGTVTSVDSISPIADEFKDLIAITPTNTVLVKGNNGLSLWNPQNPVLVPVKTTGVNYNFEATGLSAGGTIIGNATQSTNTTQGYKIVYLVGTLTASNPALVTPTKYLSFKPLAINSVNQVVGKKDTVNSKLAVTATKAYLWSSATGEKALPSLFLYAFSEPADINAKGQVVGTARFSASSTTTVAFAWSPKTGTVNLNNQIGSASSTVKVLSAKAINDAGQIAGYGLINGEYRSLLLTPKP
ncbi:DUF3466 family protein [Aquabacterium sp.]|uniref:DUF3466 family protein n=1 Tax=Aquabacterium sp. TaxID=1872578 RepID=UPI003D6CCF6E